jgi:hypothetical protein
MFPPCLTEIHCLHGEFLNKLESRVEVEKMQCFIGDIMESFITSIEVSFIICFVFRFHFFLMRNVHFIFHYYELGDLTVISGPPARVVWQAISLWSIQRCVIVDDYLQSNGNALWSEWIRGAYEASFACVDFSLRRFFASNDVLPTAARLWFLSRLARRLLGSQGIIF